MKLKLICPYGEYDDKMKIQCRAVNNRCAHIRYKPCKGWEVQTEAARNCPAREKEETDGTEIPESERD